MNKKIFIVDTNIILQGLYNITNLSQEGTNIIVIAETVLIEVENKKKLLDDVGYNAREFARFLANAAVLKIEQNDGFKVVRMSNQTIIIDIISKDRYDTPLTDNNIAESNDKRIIEVAELAKKYYKNYPVTFLSIDVYARIFALLKEVETETLRDDRAEVPKIELFKKLEVDLETLETLNEHAIDTLDPEYRHCNKSYEFWTQEGKKEYGIIHNKKILLHTKNDFTGYKIKPVNINQKLLMKAISSNLYDLIVVDAKAGSGKTLLSLYGAMRLISQGAYDKIVYTRNSIESLDKGADIGYLSGNEEKFRVYNMALYDTLEFIAKFMLKKQETTENVDIIKTKVEELMVKYRIEKLWPGEARGRTLSNAIVILDEWQNSSQSTTQLILSRLDNSCMAIVIGSNRQIDNLYLNKYNNGLTSLIKETQNPTQELNIFAIDLQTAVRGKFAEFSERIYENKSKN
ncbi:PhoH family protein [Sulfurospirillum sp. 1612]|uniref:PhoH family protein n=1 Tax=Sulfurospirillum sp. 1612 TaxID=3094835 RepID=UPI002F9358A3